MNAPVRIPEERAIEAPAEPATPARLAELVTDAFRELATRCKLKNEDATALFECALTSIELTLEIALAIPGGRTMLRDEFEQGVRTDTAGTIRWAKGDAFRDAEIERVVSARYPLPTKRVRNAFVTAIGACWFDSAHELWMAAADDDASGHPSAVAACAAIGVSDNDYPLVLALREQPPELVVPIDDPRPAID